MMAAWPWLIFFVMGVTSAIASLVGLLGHPPDPPSLEGITGLSLAEIGSRVPGMSAYIESLARQLGNFMLAFGVLLAAVAAGPFKRAERWAWSALWIVPVLLAIQPPEPGRPCGALAERDPERTVGVLRCRRTLAGRNAADRPAARPALDRPRQVVHLERWDWRRGADEPRGVEQRARSRSALAQRSTVRAA